MFIDAQNFAMRPLRNAVCVRHCGQPGHNARPCPVLLAAAHLHACFSKACFSAMHTTAESVGQQGTHARTHRRAHTHAHTCTRTPTRALTHTHTNACNYTQGRTHRYRYTHKHTHTHMHARAALAVLMGFVSYSALRVTLPNLSNLAVVTVLYGTIFLILTK
jgi:hypothetical protein